MRGTAHRHVDPSCPTWRQFVADWSATLGGRANGAGQDLVEVGDMNDGLREVLKYPCKPAALTSAQMLEMVAATKGLKSHQVFGCFHGQSRFQRRVKAGENGEMEDAWRAAHEEPVIVERVFATGEGATPLDRALAKPLSVKRVMELISDGFRVLTVWVGEARRREMVDLLAVQESLRRPRANRRTEVEPDEPG